MEQALIENLWQCIGRRDCYAVQLEAGTYARVNKALTVAILADHLAGRLTLGTYVINEQGRCWFAVLDADQENGLSLLQVVQSELAPVGGRLVLEASRRGGHGWLFFNQATPVDQVRAWLAPIAARYGLELYPKQDAGRGVGSLIRVPLGVHRRSGRRYSFLGDDLRPVGRRLSDVLAWLPSAPRSVVPASPVIPPAGGDVEASTIAPAIATRPAPHDKQKSFSSTPGARYASIREWNAAHDPFTVIGRYVELDRHGVGRCPFGEHHEGGRDDHSSFQVYQSHVAGGYCWLCHAGNVGGSLFDFLRLYHGYSATDLWHKLQTGGDVW